MTLGGKNINKCIFLILLLLLHVTVVEGIVFRDCWLLFGGVDDVGWTHATNLGRLKIHQHLRMKYPDHTFETKAYPGTFFMSEDQREMLINQTIADGCNFILAGSDNILNNRHVEYAQQFPNISFARFTASPVISSPPNFVELDGDWFPISFVAGAVAASASKTCGGFINALESAKSAWSHATGFALGYHWIKPEQPVHIVTMDSYYNPPSEVLAAQQLIEQKGCDVLGRHTDPNDVDKYILSLPASRSARSIARYVDMSTFVGDTVFTSQVIDFFEYCLTTVESAFLGAKSKEGSGALYEYDENNVKMRPLGTQYFDMKLSPFTSAVDEDLATKIQFKAWQYLKNHNPLCTEGLTWRRTGHPACLFGDENDNKDNPTKLVSYLNLPNTTYYDSFEDGGVLCGAGQFYVYDSNFSMTCMPCPENTFRFPDGRASTSCIPCANGTIAPPGSSQCTLPAVRKNWLREVSFSVEILSYFMIGAAALVNLALLGAVIYYRKESVMQLSQGIFLGVFQAAAATATISVFLFNPKSNFFCYLSSPMVLIPLQLMVAILFGRVKRILAIMLPVMQFYSTGIASESCMSKLSDKFASILMKFQKSKHLRQRKSLRAHFSNARLCAYIIIVTLPQVLLQTIGTIMFPPDLTLLMSEDESIGRYQCGGGAAQWYMLGQLGCFFCTLIMLFHESQRSQMLPALFNEAKSIANSMVGTILICSLGLIILLISSAPTASPDIRYIMMVIVVISLVSNLSLRLIMPKLRLIWAGEKVCINSMMKDHFAAKSSASVGDFTGTGTGTGTGMAQPTSLQRIPASTWSHMASSLPSDHVQMDSNASSVFGINNNNNNSRMLTFASDVNPADSNGKTIDVEDPSNNDNSSELIRVVIAEGKAPPSSVTMNIVKHKDLLTRISTRILSGLEVASEDWNCLRRACGDMNKFFNDELQYEWDCHDCKWRDEQEQCTEKQH